MAALFMPEAYALPAWICDWTLTEILGNDVSSHFWQYTPVGYISFY